MRFQRVVSLLLLCAASAALSAAAPSAAPPVSCAITEAFTRPDAGGRETVAVFEGESEPRLDGARPLFFIVGSVHVNTDGTRISYHRDDPHAQTRAINSMRNAMRRGRTIAEFEAVAARQWQPLSETWQVLSGDVIERNRQTGAPCVGPDGYLVSMTADVSVAGGWNRNGDCDQSKWIDALLVPAVVLPMRTTRNERTEFESRGAQTRTPAIMMALQGSREPVMGIVGDIGPKDELGEGSVAMNRALLGLPANELPANYNDAKRRFEGPRSVTMLLPGISNRVSYPLTGQRVQDAVQARFEAWGGAARLAVCVANIEARLAR